MAKLEITSKAIDCYDFQSNTIKTILEWHKMHKLNLSPEYQRAGVWSAGERSKLIDTIFCGYPLPAVILYERVDSRTHKKIYDAIDGKQRLETILYFMGALSGKFNRFEAKITNKVDEEIRTEHVTWHKLSEENQKEFLGYEIPCVIVQGEPSEIQEVFVRLNSTGKKLSRQEIRNAKYIKSVFLREMRRFAHRMDRVLLHMGVMNENEITRMKDIEFLSELVISVINGCVMDKKKLLDQMMTSNGVDMRSVARASRTVAEAIKIVEKILPDIRTTRLWKLCDFYSLVFWFASRRDAISFVDKQSQQLAGYLLKNFATQADEAYAGIKRGKPVANNARAVAYIQSVREGGDQKSHRRERDNILSEILKNVFEKKDPQRFFSEVQRRIVWNSTEKHACCRCRKVLRWPDFEIDHVKAHCRGGRTTIGNAALICKSCNAKKGGK